MSSHFIIKDLSTGDEIESMSDFDKSSLLHIFKPDEIVMDYYVTTFEYKVNMILRSADIYRYLIYPKVCEFIRSNHHRPDMTTSEFGRSYLLRHMVCQLELAVFSVFTEQIFNRIQLLQDSSQYVAVENLLVRLVHSA